VTFFLLGNILKNVSALSFVNTMEVNGVQCFLNAVDFQNLLCPNSIVDDMSNSTGFWV